MGQVLSRIWRWLTTKGKAMSNKRDDDGDNDKADDQQIKASHCINVFDPGQPFSNPIGTVEVSHDHHNNDANMPPTLPSASVFVLSNVHFSEDEQEDADVQPMEVKNDHHNNAANMVPTSPSASVFVLSNVHFSEDEQEDAYVQAMEVKNEKVLTVVAEEKAKLNILKNIKINDNGISLCCSTSSKLTRRKSIGLYNSTQRILLVGEGDFFRSRLAWLLLLVLLLTSLRLPATP